MLYKHNNAYAGGEGKICQSTVKMLFWVKNRVTTTIQSMSVSIIILLIPADYKAHLSVLN